MKLNIKSLISITLAFIVCLTGVLCGSVQVLAADTKNSIDYPPAVWVDTNGKERVSLSGFYLKPDGATFKIDKVTASSKNVKVKLHKEEEEYSTVNSFYVSAKKEGNYSVSVKCKIKDNDKYKFETVKIAVYAGDVDPVKSIEIDGSKLESRNINDEMAYYSAKSSGKLKINPNANIEITKIKVMGPDSSWVPAQHEGNYMPVYNSGGKAQTVKNGGKVKLNSKAKGKAFHIENRDDGELIDEVNHIFSPQYKVNEEYNFTVAKTVVQIYYKAANTKQADDKNVIFISIYTPAK